MIGLVLALAVVAGGVSLGLSLAASRLGPWLGLIDRPGSEAHKQNLRAVPVVGGIGIFWAIAAPIALIVLGVWLAPSDAWVGPLEPVAEHVPGLRATSGIGWAILATLLLMHVVGLIDDRRRLAAGPKLAAQLVAAAVLAGFFDIRVLHLLDAWGTAGFFLSVALSVVWLVAITNAFNMLDNMDGLSGGVGAIIAGVYLAATLIGGAWFVAALAALALGALVGFLCLNFPPARLYMGDSGSLVVGFMLAIISVRTSYVDLDSGMGWYGILGPLMIMAVPLYDFVSVTVLRAAAGQSPFVGDTNHFSHRLVRRGLSKRAAVIVIWLATAATALSGAMLATLAPWQAALAAAQSAAVLAMLALMERGGGIHPAQRTIHPDQSRSA